MILLIKLLGPGYVVWDKAATVRFLRPGRSTLHASFSIPEEETRAIEATLASAPSIDRGYAVELRDAAGVVHAEIEKTIFIRRQSGGDRPPDTRGSARL